MWRGLDEYMKDTWNLLDGLGLAVSLGGFVVRCVDPASPWGRSLYALSAPLLVSRVLFFAQILPFQGPMVQASAFRPAFCLAVPSAISPFLGLWLPCHLRRKALWERKFTGFVTLGK